MDFFQGTKLIGLKQIPVKLVDRQSSEDDQVCVHVLLCTIHIMCTCIILASHRQCFSRLINLCITTSIQLLYNYSCFQVGELNEFKDIPNSSGSSKPRPDQATQQQPQASSELHLYSTIIITCLILYYTK